MVTVSQLGEPFCPRTHPSFSQKTEWNGWPLNLLLFTITSIIFIFSFLYFQNFILMKPISVEAKSNLIRFNDTAFILTQILNSPLAQTKYLIGTRQDFHEISFAGLRLIEKRQEIRSSFSNENEGPKCRFNLFHQNVATFHHFFDDDEHSFRRIPKLSVVYYSNEKINSEKVRKCSPKNYFDRSLSESWIIVVDEKIEEKERLISSLKSHMEVIFDRHLALIISK